MKQSGCRILPHAHNCFRSRIFLLSLLAVLLALPARAGASFEYYGIEDTIRDDLSVQNVIVLRFKESIASLDYRLNFEIANLTAKSTFESADCSIQEGNTISCKFSGITPEHNQLTLSFDTTGVVREEGGKFLFSPTYSYPPTDKTFVLIKLPPTSVLSEDVANKSFFPPDGGIISDGKRIMVFWEMQNVSEGNLQFSVSYALPPELSEELLLAGIVGIVLIAMAGVIVYGRRRRQEVEVISAVLNADENVLVEILKREGKALQKTLVKESNFSKAKVSRLVKELKERGIVDIEPVSGRENRIILTLQGKKEEKPQQEGKEGTGNPAAS